MVELRKEFRKKGINYVQLYKSSDVVIYGLYLTRIDNGEIDYWYEVFKPIVGKFPQAYGDEDVEKYPSDEEFGVRAWSCSNDASLNKVLQQHFPNCNLSLKNVKLERFTKQPW